MWGRFEGSGRVGAAVSGLVSCLAALCGPVAAAQAGSLPEIRTSTSNRVPACVTPDRLMAFVAARNPQLDPRFGAIAAIYRDLGDAGRIRWDYAFFQMLLETNYLMYKRGDGKQGDVALTQYNFAGIGATGGGVAGDRYPDVKTGVLAQMQHLTAYSGERVERPVAARTRERQDDIIALSRKLNRPVTFADLARRWAADRGYAQNIESIATKFRDAHCSGRTAAVGAPLAVTPARESRVEPSRLGGPPAGSAASDANGVLADKALVRTVWRRGDAVPPEPRRAPRPAPAASDEAAPDVEPQSEPSAPLAQSSPTAVAPSADVSGGDDPSVSRFAFAAPAIAPAVQPAPAVKSKVTGCRIYSASYGGEAAVLVRSVEGHLTVVSVNSAQSQAMGESFIASHAPGGQMLGRYTGRDDALSVARRLCPAI